MPPPRIIIMAKQPEPGRVKSRLVQGGLSPAAAAGAAEAMLRCVVRRWRSVGPLHLAVSPDGTGEAFRRSLGLPDMPIIDQGPGDLGERMERVWLQAAPEGPVAFVGVDSPDVPRGHMDQIAAALDRADAAVGATDDGGYWTLAAGSFLPALLARIDWGSPLVYDQTCQRAREAGVSLVELPAWHDVDDVADLTALRMRLRPPQGLPEGLEPSKSPDAATGASSDDAAALQELGRRLAALLPETPSPRGAP